MSKKRRRTKFVFELPLIPSPNLISRHVIASSASFGMFPDAADATLQNDLEDSNADLWTYVYALVNRSSNQHTLIKCKSHQVGPGKRNA